MRLFLALEVPAAIGAALRAWAVDHAAGLRVLPPESLHATLVFLGERPASDVEPVAAALRAVAAPVPGLTLGGTAAMGRGTALAIDLVDGDGAVTALQRRLARALEVVETRAYRPHITVARGDRVRAAGLPPLPDPGAFAGTAVTLMRSHLGHGGARYETLASVRLDDQPT